MAHTTRVNLHCHSNCSDGVLPPEEVAMRLVAAGVRYASLTDHDTTAGLAAFRDVMARNGAGTVPGVEITAFHEGLSVHILGYAFDPTNEKLQEQLAAVRRCHDVGVQALVVSIRKIGSRLRPEPASTEEAETCNEGPLAAEDAIALIHLAGGRAFLAHPLETQPDIQKLEALVGKLKASGLDGIEAIYPSYDEGTRSFLLALARKHHLVVAAGTDFHDPTVPGLSERAIEMPTQLWRAFRNGLNRPASQADGPGLPGPETPHRPRWRNFIVRIVLPTLMAVGLFIGTIFALIIPQFESKMLGMKRDMIRELTTSAWSILAEYDVEQREGRYTLEQAQTLARERIEFLRYGTEGKDYFWITDMHPRMVMHPYRPELDGTDLTNFTDARGQRIFVEFAELVRKKNQGYVEYVWQWKDDPQREAEKESFIKGFEPWGWVIGTGIYMGDVQQEISRISRTVINASMGISAIMAMLLLFVAQQSMRFERQRFSAQEALREWNERYRSLVEAATEGTAMLLDGRCTFANRTLLDMLGYSEQEFGLLDLDDLMPADAVARLREGTEAGADAPTVEADLQRKDGGRVPCIVTMNPIDLAGQRGWILLVKDVQRHTEMVDAIDPMLRRAGRPSDNVPAGILRVAATRRGNLVEANPSARQILGISEDARLNAHRLAEFFEAPDEIEEMLQALEDDSTAVSRTLHLRRSAGTASVVNLTAVPARKNSDDETRYFDILMLDVTEQAKLEAATRRQIAKLETSLLFLHEPVVGFLRELVTCPLDTPATRVAALMNRRESSAVLITSESGDAVGIVTDRDLRERILARELDPAMPIFKVMTSPVITIPQSALVYEVLLAMEEHDIQHVAVVDEAGAPVGMLLNKELLQFPRYGASVLTREISQASSVEEVAANRERLPALVASLLDGGSRSRNITRVITSISDAVGQRLVELALQQLGPPPARFCFVVLGSEGREEQTLVTDQDNAIIYEDLPPDQAQVAADYFARLGTLVCDWLAQAGYRYCPGGFMAKNPAWCKPLAAWKENFTRWITKPEPQELMEFSIFFDLRAVHGNRELANELRQFIQQTMQDYPSFYPQFALSCLQHKPPPTGLLAKLVTAGGEQARQLNMKDAMVPIVSFARLYALRHAVCETNTVDRLDTLAEQHILTATTHEEIVLAYDHLMQLRLKHHVAGLRDHQPPTNTIPLKVLTPLEQAMIRETFTHVATIQKKISYDFLGGT